MKVTVAIPDDVFAEAESLARQLRASRSEIYSRPLGEFLGRHAPERIADQMNLGPDCCRHADHAD